MTEKAAQLPPYDPEEEARFLKDIAEFLGRASITEGEPIVVFPSADLCLVEREMSIFGNPVIGKAGRDTRLRALANSVNEVFPMTVEDQTPEPDKTKPARGAIEIRNDVDKYLADKVTDPKQPVAEDKKTKRVMTPRAELIDFSTKRRSLIRLTGSTRTNHPVGQAIRQLEELNAQRLEYNRARPESQRLTTLTETEMDQTVDDLLKATFEQSIIEVFDSQIAKLREKHQEEAAASEA